jgi:extracellular elastinolytic metalloproteinase
MSTNRHVDTRTSSRRGATALAAPPPAAPTRTNTGTGSPAVVAAVAQSPAGSCVDRAMTFVRTERARLGFGAQSVAEFTPDPVVQRTMSGSAAVHLQQEYRGIPVFQMTRTIRFAPGGEVLDGAGDSAAMPEGFDVLPRMTVTEAVQKAAEHLAATGGGTYHNQFKKEIQLPTVDIAGFTPEVLASFTLPARPTVLAKGPFENPIPAHLVVFVQPAGLRLGWHVLLTFPDHQDQYVAIVSADSDPGQILYCKSTVKRALGRGNVFEFSPGAGARRNLDFPLPLSALPVMPSGMLNPNLPGHWVDQAATDGNNVRAVSPANQTITGVSDGNGVFVFDPVDAASDEQCVINMFYFCNFAHDFLYLLGFDEAAGNFQRTNNGLGGVAGDAVQAKVDRSAANRFNAFMSTFPDGTPPRMVMGDFPPDRHSALDQDVVIHEYAHGLTNRLVGGTANTSALEKFQSGGMGEGWGDYFALTILNFSRPVEKVVTGDWVSKNAGGIRSAPYDDQFPNKYGDLVNLPIDPDTGKPEVHFVGEVWCAVLMAMTRRIRQALGDDSAGYRLAWMMVVGGLKLIPANPTFLEARDGILMELDALQVRGVITSVTHQLARRAAWVAFAHFGMGINAASDDADDANSIVADTTIPAGV